MSRFHRCILGLPWMFQPYLSAVAMAFQETPRQLDLKLTMRRLDREHGTRRLPHVNVTAHPSADWTLHNCEK
jgi:hypothetical protein